MTHRLTEIKETKKGRYALFFDGEFYFSVDEETLIKHHLEVDSEYSGTDVEMIREDSDYLKAKDKAFDLLALRDHSENELYRKLLNHFDSHTAAATVARIRELGYLDDRKFAEKLVREYSGKGKSRAEIRNKLYEKGISREIMEEALSLLEEDESEAAYDLICRKYSEKIKKENGKQLVAAALARRGYRGTDIRKVLSRFGYEVTEDV